MRSAKGKPKLCSNWISVNFLGVLNKANLEIAVSPINAERLAELLKRIADNTISGKTAKQVFDILWESDLSADEIIE